MEEKEKKKDIENKEDKKNQVMYLILVLVFITILIIVSLFLNGKIKVKPKENTIKEKKLTEEEIKEEVLKAQKERQDLAEKYLEEKGTDLEVTFENFEEKILKADKPVLIDYYAIWCEPCHQMSPIIEELAKEQDDFYVYKINIDLEQELAFLDKIVYMPTFVIYNKGKRVNAEAGVRTKDELINLVKESIK